MGDLLLFEPPRRATPPPPMTNPTRRHPLPAVAEAPAPVPGIDPVLLLRMHTDLAERVRYLEQRERELDARVRELEQDKAATAPSSPGGPPRTEAEHREEEKAKILEALAEHRWNRSDAADALGIPRRTFYRKLKEYGIQ